MEIASSLPSRKKFSLVCVTTRQIVVIGRKTVDKWTGPKVEIVSYGPQPLIPRPKSRNIILAKLDYNVTKPIYTSKSANIVYVYKKAEDVRGS